MDGSGENHIRIVLGDVDRNERDSELHVEKGKQAHIPTDMTRKQVNGNEAPVTLGRLHVYTFETRLLSCVSIFNNTDFGSSYSRA